MIARIVPIGNHDYYLTSDGRITRFTRSELACRCGCGLADMQEITIDAVHESRTRFTYAMFPSSGVRCWPHNTAKGGAPKSAHPDGLAIDLSSEQPLWDLAEVLGLFFTRLCVYSRSLGFFCHVDMRPARLRKVLTKDGDFTMPEFFGYYKLDLDISRDRIQEILEAT